MAVRFLIGGRGRDALVETRAEAFGSLVRFTDEADMTLWWARRRGRCGAVALVVSSPGAMGMLFHSPLGAPGVQRDALDELMGAICGEALAGGLRFVQALLSPDDSAGAEVMLSAGFRVLAELVYLERDLAAGPTRGEARDELTWRCYGEFDEAGLARLIEATYEGSLDCPELRGVRSMEEVLAAHKTSGTFRGDSWWIAECHGAPVGCILVNDSARHASAEIVYLGVAPRHRGRGYGRAMVRHALAHLAGRSLATVRLAVDGQNTFARAAYDAEGFRQVTRRTAFVRFAPPQNEPRS